MPAAVYYTIYEHFPLISSAPYKNFRGKDHVLQFTDGETRDSEEIRKCPQITQLVHDTTRI